jgi:GNAT superfamily N-acetyltransferase
LSRFECGDNALDEWLKKWAAASAASDTAQTYVVQEDGVVVGYFSICTGSISRQEASERVAKGQAARPIPVILLARLAVDHRYQKRGLGAALLKNALLRIAEAADVIGARAVLVHAANDAAKDFYSHFGFEVGPGDPYQLMLLMKDVRRNLSP